MKLSTRSRYGTRAMLEFARNWGKGPVSLTEAAAAQDISLKYLEHIVATLKAAGLLTAVRGRRGGYTLTRSPEKIRLDEIVEALEGGLNPVECLAEDPVCPKVATCAARRLWADVKDAVVAALAQRSLKDLLAMEAARTR
jgi:Rrf2 family protein